MNAQPSAAAPFSHVICKALTISIDSVISTAIRGFIGPNFVVEMGCSHPPTWARSAWSCANHFCIEFGTHSTAC